MLKYIFILFWWIVLTLVVIPICYLFKICITIVPFIWDFNVYYMKHIYWGGIETTSEYYGDKRYSWKKLYQRKW